MDLETLKSEHPDLVEAILAEVKENQDVEALRGELKKLRDEVAERDKKIDEYAAKEKLAAHRAMVETKLSEAKLHRELITDVFREQLETAPDEATVDKLIADRAELSKHVKTASVHQPEKPSDFYSQGTDEVTEADVEKFIKTAFI